MTIVKTRLGNQGSADRTTFAPEGSVQSTNVQKAIAELAAETQPISEKLTNLANMDDTPGLVIQTGDNTFDKREIVGPGEGITVTDGDGVAGNPTIALANDLAALEGLSSTGLIARTADGAAAVRTLTAPAAGITVSNGDGVSGNPTLALANDLAALEGLTGTGFISRIANNAASVRTLTAGPGIIITNGDGVAGSPTISADVSGAVGYVVPTALSIATTAIPPIVDVIQTLGYRAEGDGGHALYYRHGSSDPSENGSHQDSTGVWWRLLPVGEVNPIQFGAYGVADEVNVDSVDTPSDSVGLQAMFDYTRKYIFPGNSVNGTGRGGGGMLSVNGLGRSYKVTTGLRWRSTSETGNFRNGVWCDIHGFAFLGANDPVAGSFIRCTTGGSNWYDGTVSKVSSSGEGKDWEAELDVLLAVVSPTPEQTARINELKAWLTPIPMIQNDSMFGFVFRDSKILTRGKCSGFFSSSGPKQGKLQNVFITEFDNPAYFGPDGYSLDEYFNPNAYYDTRPETMRFRPYAIRTGGYDHTTVERGSQMMHYAYCKMWQRGTKHPARNNWNAYTGVCEVVHNPDNKFEFTMRDSCRIGVWCNAWNNHFVYEHPSPNNQDLDSMWSGTEWVTNYLVTNAGSMFIGNYIDNGSFDYYPNLGGENECIVVGNRFTKRPGTDYANDSAIRIIAVSPSQTDCAACFDLNTTMNSGLPRMFRFVERGGNSFASLPSKMNENGSLFSYQKQIARIGNSSSPMRLLTGNNNPLCLLEFDPGTTSNNQVSRIGANGLSFVVHTHDGSTGTFERLSIDQLGDMRLNNGVFSRFRKRVINHDSDASIDPAVSSGTFHRTNSANAVVLTLPKAAAQGFSIQIGRQSSGTLVVIPESGATIDGLIVGYAFQPSEVITYTCVANSGGNSAVYLSDRVPLSWRTVARRTTAEATSLLTFVTGDTSEHDILTLSNVIPANSLGPNGMIKVWSRWVYEGTAAIKTPRIKFGGTTFFSNGVAATNLITQSEVMISNFGATNLQHAFDPTIASQVGNSPNGLTTSTIDTTSAQSIVFTMQLTNGADKGRLDDYLVQVMYGP